MVERQERHDEIQPQGLEDLRRLSIEAGEIARKAPIPFGQEGAELADIDAAFRFAEMVFQSGLAPESVQSPQAVVAILATGAEMGLRPMESLRSLNVVRGRVVISAEVLHAKVQQSGQLRDEKITVEHDDQGNPTLARVEMLREGQESTHVGEFSLSDAARAGLLGKGAWKLYPEDMLVARALARCCRRGFADVTRGLHATEEFVGSEEPETRTVVPQTLQDLSPRQAVDNTLDQLKAAVAHAKAEEKTPKEDPSDEPWPQQKVDSGETGIFPAIGKEETT